MLVNNFYSMITRIYALFGKTKPNSDIMNGIYESVKSIPDEAINGIIARFEELPELKAGINIAKLINTFYERPVSEQKFHCEYCNNKGYFWGIQQAPDGSYTDFISLCPNCTGKGQDCETYSQMVKRGAMVMPPNYKGSVYAWAREKYSIEFHKTPHHTHED